MKVGTVLDEVNKFKPNAIDQDDLISKLNTLESTLVLEVFRESEFTSLNPGDTEVELRAPTPYDRIYAEYLEAVIDKYNEDMDSYSISSRAFNDTMGELKKYVRRNGLDNPVELPRITGVM